MEEHALADKQLRILSFWWMLELFSPQSLPKVTKRASRPPDRQVVEWHYGEPLPWEELPAPEPVHGTRRVWRHTVYLGVYKLEDTYETLHRVFNDDADAYDERPGGQSACAGILIDHNGRIVADSPVLSSALWAVARTYDPGPMDPRWMEGFDASLKAFSHAVDAFEGHRREAAKQRQPPPYDRDALCALLKLAQKTAGIDGFESLATDRVLVQSVAISARRTDEQADSDFLNSFFLDDLAAVRDHVARSDIGPALTAYLTSDDGLLTNHRIDVVREPEVVNAHTSIDRLPKGRWPANAKHSLALSQQFAVNKAMNEMAPSAGLMGVNGPPGTGKTTMLRDILAGNVVERARRLAALENANDAYTGTTYSWTAESDYPRSVRQLRPELTGFEMVVASANNTAVENVTNEIPAVDAIDDTWHGRADYFATIATEVLRATTDNAEASSSQSTTAWGLVAARLGKKRNRSTFHSAFWFDPQDPTTGEPVEDGLPRMQTMLKEWRDGTRSHKTWARARAEFWEAQRKVDNLIQERHDAQERQRQMPKLAEHLITLQQTIDQKLQQLQRIRADLALNQKDEQQAQAARADAAQQYDRHLAAKPGSLETVFTFGRAVRNWRAKLEPLAHTLNAVEAHEQAVVERGRRIRTAHQIEQEHLSASEHDLLGKRREHAELLTRCSDDEAKFGAAYPGNKWTGDTRELRAPWLDDKLDTARSDLFLAALELHRDFLASTATTMLEGLRAAGEVIAGKYPHNLEAEKLRAAWQLFFITVPMVSTTFASASRMFGNVGREAIGWLLVDEAGQASPQYAAGAIWRARRVIAVGDPLQLQPVVTIPKKAQHDIAQSYGVSTTWIPPKASVQALVDRVEVFGTELHQGQEKVWVGAPLRVHRRCDEPMFSLCNKIAYNGIMVNGVHRNSKVNDPFSSTDPASQPIAASHWADEPADTPGTHLQINQIERLKKALAYLNRLGVPESQVIAISPFRAVADQLSALTANYPGLRAGTIHTAQGRESPVVILVLGGDPNSPGAKDWAASIPNLVNVAASRARRRLYVIGDRTTWSKYNYFRELSATLD